MKAKSSTSAGGSAVRKTPRNRVSSPWVHKNQSNIVSRGRPKGTNIRSEIKLKRKTYEKNLAGVEALTVEARKIKLALESPVSNGNSVSKRSSRKKTSLHTSLNEESLFGKETPEKLALDTPTSNGSSAKKRSSHRARRSLHNSLNEHGLRQEKNSEVDGIQNVKKEIEIEESRPASSDEEMEIDTGIVSEIGDSIKKEDNLPAKDPANWSCNIL